MAARPHCGFQKTAGRRRAENELPGCPMTNEARPGGVGLFFLGLLLGATVAGVGVYVLQQRQLERRLADADSQAVRHVGKELVGGLMTPANGGASVPMEDRIKKIGDAGVEDLRVDRLLSVYRLTTPA